MLGNAELSAAGSNGAALLSSAFMIMCCFSLQGVLMEKVYRTDGFQHGEFCVLLELLVYSVSSSVCIACTSGRMKSGKKPVLWYMGVGGSVSMARLLTLVSLHYITFPTGNLFKSSKVIPVMLVGVLFMGKSYKLQQYVAACLMVAGVIVFTVTDRNIQPNFHPAGVAAIVASLGFDAITAEVQERTLRQYERGELELIQWSNLLGFAVQLVILAAAGSLVGSASFFWHHSDVCPVFVLSAFSGFVGTLYFVQVIRRFGAIVAVLLGICRKAVSITLSFLVYPKPFSILYIVGAVLFFLGLTVEVESRHPHYLGALVARAAAVLRSRPPEMYSFDRKSPLI